ncbi:aldo/keto reductase [Acidipila rosea]|uniref:Putative aldo/keto reductase-like oxidoreductase n=1 Tax=Acidipila rosea TaxID=768535 RepID=A0A4R1LFU6_9BACT|nr:aldo/keto reductase [Acidipila rosea]TCK75723.1 putative aldo/keto reductase-like oxidoreductase [Acidipila rosea]
MERRDFLKSAALAAMATAVHNRADAAGTHNGIPYRTLGRTGASVSMVGIGGHHIGRNTVPAEEATRIVHTALDSGINFLDNCWDYNDGVSEERMGVALQGGYRQKAFLMTKLDGRTAQLAQQQLEQSLKRLKTDHIDLIQIHEVIRMTDPERVFAPGGSLEYLRKAREQGKVRFIGFTGHKSPEIHLHMIETATKHGFTFDTVQMPLNVMDAHFDSFQKLVIPVAQKLNMGILGMKPMGDGIILKSNVVTPVECLQYAMNLPTSVVITGCDSMKILNQAIDTAKNFHPMNQEQVSALLAKTETVAKGGQFELYKTSHNFDGTYKNPQWLG